MGLGSRGAIVEYVGLQPAGEAEFLGALHVGVPGQAFGGQVAAQALMAAGLTAHGLRPHSVHGYFLSPGRLGERVRYRVQTLRDGRTYASRLVTGVQSGAAGSERNVVSFMASFKVEESGPERQRSAPSVPDPEDLPDPYPAWRARRREEFDAALVAQAVATRVPPRTGDQRQTTENLLWLRATGEVSQDPLLNACALTYMSDLAVAPTTALDREEIRTLRIGPRHYATASLDHAMWFHRPVRADDWHLFGMHGSTATDARGLAGGHIWDRSGRLVASVAQETVLRPLTRA